MSALPPTADMAQCNKDVRYVPQGDIRTAANAALFDHLVGLREECRRNFESERLGGLEVDDKQEV